MATIKVTSMPDNFSLYIRKPIVVKALKVDNDFEIDIEGRGTLKGKAGDYLIENTDGDLFPCDNWSFEKNYVKRTKNINIETMMNKNVDGIENITILSLKKSNNKNGETVRNVRFDVMLSNGSVLEYHMSVSPSLLHKFVVLVHSSLFGDAMHVVKGAARKLSTSDDVKSDTGVCICSVPDKTENDDVCKKCGKRIIIKKSE